MGIELKLKQLPEGHIKAGKNKARDIEKVKFYYGLSDFQLPSLEEIASRFLVGKRESHCFSEELLFVKGSLKW